MNKPSDTSHLLLSIRVERCARFPWGVYVLNRSAARQFQRKELPRVQTGMMINALSAPIRGSIPKLSRDSESVHYCTVEERILPGKDRAPRQIYG
jgi:hypothetical protein